MGLEVGRVCCNGGPMDRNHDQSMVGSVLTFWDVGLMITVVMPKFGSVWFLQLFC